MASKTQSYWLLKTEPETYSFERLLKDGRTNWNGVRNFQARNFLKTAKVGDLALIYHSVSEKAIVGIAKVVKEAYPDIDPDHPGEWVQIDIAPVQAFKKPVTLEEIKKDRQFSDLLLLKQSRLSSMPLNSDHYQALVKMSESKGKATS